MFGARNVVRPSARGGKGGRPIQAPMRGRRRGSVKPSRQAKLFDPRTQGRINQVAKTASKRPKGLFDPRTQGRINKVGGRGPARAAQSRANKLRSPKARLINPRVGSGPTRGTGMLATGRGRAVRGGPVRAARRPQYKRR